MLPSQRSRMERFPTCRCCSSCMDKALRKAGGGTGWGSGRGQILDWGEESPCRQPLETKMQVSLTYTPVGYATKGGAAWSKEGWGEQQLGRRRAGVACKSQEMGIGGSS